MANRKWKATKLQPGTTGPGNLPGSCLVSFHFLWAILCPQAVLLTQQALSFMAVVPQPVSLAFASHIHILLPHRRSSIDMYVVSLRE